MRYQSFLRKSTYRRYGIFILTIFFSYYSIQAIINNKTIDASIEEVRKNNHLIQEEIDFKTNFYQNYLKGEYASYFLWHENWQLYRSERIIKIKQRLTPFEETTLPEREGEERIRTPQESRQFFIANRLSELRTLWIIQ